MRASHIKDIEKITSIFESKGANPPTLEMVETMSDYMFDMIPDWVRIIICFENYMKAVLLKNGFLIHKIDRDEKALKTLANNQNKRPIKLKEFNELFNFSVEIESRLPILEGLKPQTLDFNVLLRKKYQDEINLPTDILESISKINTKRNTLHFYHEVSNSYDKHFFKELRDMEKFVLGDMKQLYFQLQAELNVSQRNLHKAQNTF